LLSVAFTVATLMILSRGQGLWLSFAGWETKATQQLLFKRANFSILGKRPIVFVGLRWWTNRLEYRRDLAIRVANLLDTSPSLEYSRAIADAVQTLLPDSYEH
jgi:hypothetical protein